MRIGIMQGRLVEPSDGRIQCFPREHWAEEFDRAAQAGLDCIEWIYDQHGADANPLATAEGIRTLRSLTLASGVGVFSICADWFMDFPLVRASPEELEHRLTVLKWLLRRSQEWTVGRLVLPFVDFSRMDTREEMDQIAVALGKVVPVAEETGVEIHLETSLSPMDFSELLGKLPSRWIKVNYDSGNSASLGFDPAEEFSAYGTRIGSIHIKDRILGGGTVPLGRGDTNFTALRNAIAGIDYSGDYILQVARGDAGGEVEWARSNLKFVSDWLPPREGTGS